MSYKYRHKSLAHELCTVGFINRTRANRTRIKPNQNDAEIWFEFQTALIDITVTSVTVDVVTIRIDE